MGSGVSQASASDMITSSLASGAEDSTSASPLHGVSQVACLGKGKFGVVNCYMTADKQHLFAGKWYSREDYFEKRQKRIASEIEVLRVLCNSMDDNEKNRRDSRMYSNKSRPRAATDPVDAKSPYIIDMYGSFFHGDNDSFCIYMEAVLGGSLDRHLTQAVPKGHFDVWESLNYLVEIISALKYMNDRGCVHRDIKANNVLLTATGHIRIVDFGSAKCTYFDSAEAKMRTERSASIDENLIGYRSQRAPPSMLSNIKAFVDQQRATSYEDVQKLYTIIGSMQFMAPEMIMLAKTKEDSMGQSDMSSLVGYSTPADWYSVGVLLFEMLTGSWPAENSSFVFFSLEAHAVKICDAINMLASKLEVEEQTYPALVPLTIDLLKGLLHEDPAQRLGSWHNMDALQEHGVFTELGVDWKSVDMGLTFPADINFNKRLGNLDLLELFAVGQKEGHDQEGNSDPTDGDVTGLTEGETPLTDEQQNLFADF
jgi:serine/threonine protein kinase